MKDVVPRYVVIQKKRGETPLQAIEGWKATHAEYASLPASYAGRLDPMAEGKLLVLLGEECKQQKEYTDLDKEYEIEIVLDLGTDTGDALGMPTYANTESALNKDDIQKAEEAVQGAHMIPYPVYSSKTVDGQPLFMYALANTLSSIEIPEHIETIYRLALIRRDNVSKDELQKRVQEMLSIVPRSDEPSKALGADFRQDAIREAWEKAFTKIPDRTFILLRYRVTCASGTYMRTLAERIATHLGTKGFALSIKRTRIGAYRKLGPVGFWAKEY